MVYKAPAYSLRGVVASEHPLATLAGIEVLEEGGNAVDAAVATSLALAVVLPHLGGLGGDFFALARVNGDTIYIDGSGPAPRKLTPELVESRGYREMPRYGPLTVTVPGMVDALWRMWEQAGRLEWGRLVEPAIRIARDGFAASPSLVKAVDRMWSHLSQDPGASRAYSQLHGKQPGAPVYFKGLAEALRRIEEDPRDFYEGDLAREIAGYIAERGGVLSIEDLAEYRAGVGSPLSITYRGCTVSEMPPPTQGLTTLHILMKLATVDPPEDPRGRDRASLILEASRIAYSIRDRYITDPRYMPLSAEDLLDPSILDGAQQLGGPWGDGDTTYFAVADRWGNIVSGIQSLYHHFGSQLATRPSCIPLNNRGSDFTLRRDHVNRLEPGKRTLHTLSAVLLDCRGTYAIGTSGGHYRPHQHAQLITNIVDYGMDPQDAVEHPRMLIDFQGARIMVEEGIEPPEAPGFKVERLPYPSRTGVAAMVYTGGYRSGHSDIRGDGASLGQP